ncbi:MAG: HAD-IIB family hydrolase [Cellvibrionaceae bacterium]|nr:HAD-IIB family hydrolase [Cellvibrionaceae bacterium]
MTKTRSILIFTDIDGTLLDLDNASWTAAENSLQQAKGRGIPIILSGSRTFEECVHLQRQMNLRGPLIFENGAGVALPQSQFRRPSTPAMDEQDGFWLCRVAQPYTQVRAILQSLRQTKHYQFRGFGDMSELQISDYTNQDLAMARLAKQRRHSEVLYWLDDAKSFDAFAKDTEKQGLKLSRGSQSIHIGSPCDKGQAMRWLVSLYQKLLGSKPLVMALGDSGNDLGMLQSADIAVVVRPPHTIPLSYRPANANQRLLVTEEPGPAGWDNAVKQLLDEISVPA